MEEMPHVVVRRREVPPYRIVAKIKNNRLWTAIQETFPDARSQAEAAQRLGVDPNRLSALLTMRKFPFSARKATWWSIAVQIATRLGLSPEYLFDPALYGRRPISSLEFELTPSELPALGLLTVPESPDDTTERHLLAERIAVVLDRLTPREAVVLRQRFGLDGQPPKELEEIGEQFDVTRERIHQIETKALRKLRHPTLSKALKGFVEP